MTVATDNFEVGLSGQKYTIKKGASGLEVWRGPADSPTALMGTVTADGFQAPRLELGEVYGSGTGPGSSAAAWQARVLSTTYKNTISGASTNGLTQFTLPAGTYRVSGWAQGFSCGRFVLAVRRVDTGADILIGQNAYVQAGLNVQGTCHIDGYITLEKTVTMSLVQYCETAVAQGLGVTSISATMVAARLSIVKEA
jgi:hypothetical protein